VRERRATEVRPIGECLDLAGCEGDQRARAEALAPHGPDTLAVELGWYLLRRP
jgi:hypothetical protein